MKGQVAFEYILIVGLLLFFLIPLWAYSAGIERQASSELATTYAQNAANKLANQADLVHSQGPPAKINTQLYIPPGVQNITIIDSTIIFRMQTDYGLTDVVAIANTNISASLPTTEGNYQISVEATPTGANISIL